MPEKNDELNKKSLMYINEYLQQNKNKKALLIIDKEKIGKEIYSSSYFDNLYIRTSSQLCIKMLLDCISISPIDKTIIVLSYDKPRGRFGKDIIGLFDITEEDLICHGLFRKGWWGHL